MVKRSDILLTDDCCNVLNVSNPCWYAQLFFLFFGEYYTSEDNIDFPTMVPKLKAFYKEVLPRFHCQRSELIFEIHLHCIKLQVDSAGRLTS